MMRGFKPTAFRATILLALTALIRPVAAAPVETPAEQQVGAEKQIMMDLGLQQDTSWDLYLYLKEQAGGGNPLSWDDMPDWTGLWVKTPSEVSWLFGWAFQLPREIGGDERRLELVLRGIGFDSVDPRVLREAAAAVREYEEKRQATPDPNATAPHRDGRRCALPSRAGDVDAI